MHYFHRRRTIHGWSVHVRLQTVLVELWRQLLLRSVRAVVVGEGEGVGHVYVRLLVRRRRTTELDFWRRRPAERTRSHGVHWLVRVVRSWSQHRLQREWFLVGGQEVGVGVLAGLEEVLVAVAQRLLREVVGRVLVHLVLQVRRVALVLLHRVLQRLHGLDHLLDLYVGYRQFGILLSLTVVLRRLVYPWVHFSQESALALISTEIVIIRFRIDYFLYFLALI